MAWPAALLLLAGAGAPAARLAPAPGLTEARSRALARDFVCPARLPEDARFRAMLRFQRRYSAWAPRSTPVQQLAFHARLERLHHCPEPARGATYTVPID